MVLEAEGRPLLATALADAIDQHYDALRAGIHVRKMPDLRATSAQSHLSDLLKTLAGRIPRFRWDNYLSIYLRQFKDQLRMLRLVTPKDGDRPRFQPQTESASDEFPENINFWLDDGPWVVNVDLDYIFCADASGDWIQMVSDDYIVETIRGIRKAMNDDHMAVVCLTPDGFTPGWPECLRLSKRIFEILRTSHP